MWARALDGGWEVFVELLRGGGGGWQGRDEVEVVEARFWLVLALPVCTWAGWRWLSMVTKDTPGRQATRGEDWNKSGRQAAM